jgi:hypothetical protein
MTHGANESPKADLRESVAREAHVKNNYVDCASKVDVQRARRPLPPPDGPALVSAVPPTSQQG